MKNIELGQYPNIYMIKKMQNECNHLPITVKEKLYIYFKTKTGLKKRKLFK